MFGCRSLCVCVCVSFYLVASFHPNSFSSSLFLFLSLPIAPLSFSSSLSLPLFPSLPPPPHSVTHSLSLSLDLHTVHSLSFSVFLSLNLSLPLSLSLPPSLSLCLSLSTFLPLYPSIHHPLSLPGSHHQHGIYNQSTDVFYHPIYTTWTMIVYEVDRHNWSNRCTMSLQYSTVSWPLNWIP